MNQAEKQRSLVLISKICLEQLLFIIYYVIIIIIIFTFSIFFPSSTSMLVDASVPDDIIQ